MERHQPPRPRWMQCLRLPASSRLLGQPGASNGHRGLRFPHNRIVINGVACSADSGQSNWSTKNSPAFLWKARALKILKYIVRTLRAAGGSGVGNINGGRAPSLELPRRSHDEVSRSRGPTRSLCACMRQSFLRIDERNRARKDPHDAGLIGERLGLRGRLERQPLGAHLLRYDYPSFRPIGVHCAF